MTPEVNEAVEELKIAFPNSSVAVIETGDGGVQVTLDPVDLGEQYVQRETWIAFNIGFQYPLSDIYPLFVRPDLTRHDGAALGPGISLASFNGIQAQQLSRRSVRLNPSVDTAILKVTKVLTWLRNL